MVRDLEAAKKLCVLSEAEECLLLGPERPIVLLKAEKDNGPAPGLAPDTDLLGLMLPYTPLHHVLFAALASDAALVMTSGNVASEPICLGNREALRRLRSLADYFLLHDRDILIRCDDSVLRLVDQAPQFIRRARGYTPSPVDLDRTCRPVLGVGALLKNTVCLLKGRQAFVSQHIGDLENMEAHVFFEETVSHLTDILQVSPTAVVHDLHPDFFSTRYAQQTGLPCLALQHHFAHIYAVLAENQFTGKVVGLALDGSGLGTDGTIWGGEALLVDGVSRERLARFSQVPLPGGDKAVQEPWRMAKSYLHALGLTEPESRPWPWLEDFGPADPLVGQMLERGVNSPPTSSCGRLFDAVAALLGLCLSITYEGQAAVLLEAVQDKSEEKGYSCPVIQKDGLLELDIRKLFAQVYMQWNDHTPPALISRRFHLGLIAGLEELTVRLCREHSCRTVALSGGVMHNATIARRLPRNLQAAGLRVLEHKLLPPGDGCLSLGQAFYGNLILETPSEQI
jgi:hydrogenase maturation protein HypF